MTTEAMANNRRPAMATRLAPIWSENLPPEMMHAADTTQVGIDGPLKFAASQPEITSHRRQCSHDRGAVRPNGEHAQACREKDGIHTIHLI
jgi:hypothetical protein